MKARPGAETLFVASEIYPFAKTGGLADVAFSLPKALSENRSIAAVMPLYRSIDQQRFGIGLLDAGAVTLGGETFPFELYGCVYEGVTCYFIYAPLLSERDHLYGPPKQGYADNDLRFGIFCQAVMALAEACGTRLLHLNDWQSALCALLVRMQASALRTLYTIHNLAYQGVFDAGAMRRLGIPDRYFTMEGVEFYGQLNLMKAGIACADRVTTVSPGYAQEILRPEFGCGLEGFLQSHAGKLSGILNGIDTEHFDPETDPALPARYSAATPGAKADNKRRFLDHAGLDDPGRPLFVFISRLSWQKGVEAFADALETFREHPINVAILGEGEPQYMERLDALARSSDRISLAFGYDEALSHRMYAAADFVVMPSRYEPCGLNQMIAMRYGAMPVVHAVGGLKDTVAPLETFDPASRAGFGALYDDARGERLEDAMDVAIACYNAPELFGRIRRHNMGVDFSWDRSAEAYAAHYAALLDPSYQPENEVL